MLFNAYIWQNVTLKEVDIEKQKEAKETFTKKLKTKKKVESLR